VIIVPETHKQKEQEEERANLAKRERERGGRRMMPGMVMCDVCNFNTSTAEECFNAWNAPTRRLAGYFLCNFTRFVARDSSSK
jgi:hypothetical protein